MQGRVQKDVYFSNSNSKPRVQWIESQNNKVPEGCFVVTDCNPDVGDHYVMFCEVSNKRILKKFVLGDTAEAINDGAKFLRVGDSSVTWKKMITPTRFAPGVITCEQPGNYGNIYVGRCPKYGVGMVVAMDEMSFCFLTHDGKIEKEDFDVLSYSTN